MYPPWVRTHTRVFAWDNFDPSSCPPWPEHHLTLRSSPFPSCLKGPLVRLGPEQGSDCVCVPGQWRLLPRPGCVQPVPVGLSLLSCSVGPGEAVPGLRELQTERQRRAFKAASVTGFRES